MLTFDPKQLSEREVYKLLIGSIIPRPVAVVTTESAKRVLNIAPFSYFNIVSTQPTLLSIAVQRKKGSMKDTTRNLLTTKEAVIHTLDSENVVAANQAAASLPPEVSELTVSDFTLIASTILRVPGIQEAKVRFETTLYRHIPIEHEGITTADLLLLEVQHYHIADEIYHEGRIDPVKLAAVSRLAGSNYAKIGEIFALERPH